MASALLICRVSLRLLRVDILHSTAPESSGATKVLPVGTLCGAAPEHRVRQANYEVLTLHGAAPEHSGVSDVLCIFLNLRGAAPECLGRPSLAVFSRKKLTRQTGVDAA